MLKVHRSLFRQWYNINNTKKLLTTLSEPPLIMSTVPKKVLISSTLKDTEEYRPKPKISHKFPRPIRQEPGPVVLGFIPEEWFLYFIPKTGVTGFGTFMFTTSTALISKEIYIMEHEYYSGLSMLVVCVAAAKYMGADVAKYIDKGIDEYEATWSEERTAKKKMLEELIGHENYLQNSCSGQLLLVEAKRENVALQQEAVYRERLMDFYRETKKRLDHAVARNFAEMHFIQRYIAKWVVNKVMKSLSQQLQDRIFVKCLDELELIAKQISEPEILKVTV